MPQATALAVANITAQLQAKDAEVSPQVVVVRSGRRHYSESDGLRS